MVVMVVVVVVKSSRPTEKLNIGRHVVVAEGLMVVKVMLVLIQLMMMTSRVHG